MEEKIKKWEFPGCYHDLGWGKKGMVVLKIKNALGVSKAQVFRFINGSSEPRASEAMVIDRILKEFMNDMKTGESVCMGS